MRKIGLLIFITTSYSLCAQPNSSALLQHILAGNKNNMFIEVLKHPETYRLQIIYTQINRDKQNVPVFTHYYFNVDSLFYFNPASTVKLPLAALALEKLHEKKIPGVNKFTPVQFDSAYPHQQKELYDSTAANNYASIAQFIRKAFLISDNDAYNRLYQFVGQQSINRKLHAKGYSDISITKQFMGYTDDENRHTNPVNFIDTGGKFLYHQPMQYNTDSFDFTRTVKIGKAYLNNKDSLINEPIDFTRANNLPLKDLQQVLQSILFPLSVPEKQRFNFSEADYDFLAQFLSQYPSETNYPKYDTGQYYDSYVKFFFQDSAHHNMPSNIRVFNKVGWAYGFLTDVSYIADFKNNIEFMLAATLYVNSDGILNDNKYDYETIGHPFLYQLGQTIYNYELTRKRKYNPDLRHFKIQYEKRNPNDTRPSIKDADN